jgi:uncharacterized protein (DUF924 family)
VTGAARDVVAFWVDAGPDRWFAKDPGFDERIRARFGEAVAAARRGELDSWAETAEGALALLLLLDQFPRNLFRGSPDAYASDAKARDVADRAVARGFDKLYPVPLRRFFYTPFMHSEHLADQERSVALAEASGDPDGLCWAEHHRDIVRRFGRFPHRNAVLGRAATDEERRFIDEDGFGG